MGRVYKAEQVDLGRVVALKVLPADAGKDPQRRQRFHREAKSVALLNHPGISRVFDFGQTRSGDLFLALEFANGGSLSDRLLRRPPRAQLLSWFAEVLDSLVYAHAHGVIHRDLKPHNVLLHRGHEGREHTQIVDFGIAGIVGQRARITASTRVSGTPHYMAPEQATGAHAHPAADIYAVATMLYEMLCGRLPFRGPSPTEFMYQKVRFRPRPLDTRRPDLPKALADLVMRGLEPDPGKRWPSAKVMLEALLPLLDDVDQIKHDRFDLSLHGSGGRGATDAMPSAIPLVGRAAEQSRIAEWLERTVTERLPGLVLVEGPTGVGKTRLADWAAAWTLDNDRMSVIRLPARTSNLLQQLLAELLGVEVGDRSASEAAARALFEGEDRHDDDETAQVIEALSLEGMQPRDEVVERGLRRTAANRPLLLVLDEVHELPPQLDAWLDHLLTTFSLRPAPVLILATASTDAPADAHGHRRSISGIVRHRSELVTRIRLGPLPEEDTVELLRWAGIAHDRAVVVARRSGGVPLVALHLAPAAHDEHVPSGVSEYLTGRLQAARAAHGGAAATDEVLLTLGVLQKGCTARMLYEVLDRTQGLDRDTLDDALDALQEPGLVREHPEPLPGENLSLHPPVMGPWLASRLDPAVAKNIHSVAADVAIELFGEDTGPALAMIAHHLERAERPRDARRFRQLAAHQATRVGRFVDAAHHHTRLANRGSVAAALDAARAHRRACRYAEALRWLDQVEAHAPVELRPELEIEAVRLLARRYEPARAEQRLHRLRASLRSTALSRALRATADLAEAELLWAQEHADEARALLYGLEERLGDPLAKAEAWLLHSRTAIALGLEAEARGALERAGAVLRAEGISAFTPHALFLQALLEQEATRRAALLRRAASAALSLDQTRVLVAVLLERAALLVQTGDHQTGEIFGERGLHLATGIEDRPLRARALRQLAACRAAAGDEEASNFWLERARGGVPWSTSARADML
ncbi:MAG: protein kinase [Deltaproteobacteria bacterium]|nr:protein kinase [Deltaproteobacteria bacterium]MBW2534012.1 protein kinase [Deltaproteobacteria bacterium]